MLAPTSAIHFQLRSAHDYKLTQVHPHPPTHTHPIFIAYSLLLTARERSSEYFSIPGATQENLELNPLSSLESHQNHKDDNLD